MAIKRTSKKAKNNVTFLSFFGLETPKKSKSTKAKSKSASSKTRKSSSKAQSSRTKKRS